MNNEELLQKVAHHLKKQHLHIATAESCTGGLLAHLLTNIPGSSDYFIQGVITYSNTAKEELLGVPKETIQKYGAVSEQTAYSMATGIKNKSNVDLGVATTGIAGPTGGTTQKPVGLVYIALATPTSVHVKKFLFSGTRLQNKENTCYAALQLLLEYLESQH